jgi:hypothetical protein
LVGRGVVGAGVVRVGPGLAVDGAAVRVGDGASVVGATVRIWSVRLGVAEADGLDDAEPPAKRERPPLIRTPISSSVSRPPATAARTRSIQRGPRRGGGMIFVVSDMRISTRRLCAQRAYGSGRMRLLLAAALISADICGGTRPFAGIDRGASDERLGTYDAAAREC